MEDLAQITLIDGLSTRFADVEVLLLINRYVSDALADDRSRLNRRDS